MKGKLLIAVVFVASLVFLCNAQADLIVRPAKLGVLTLEIFPFSPAVVERSFEVGNTYNISINITLGLNGNLTDIVKLSKDQFLLQSNETQEVDYTVSVTTPGVYIGGVTIKVSSEYGMAKIAYQNDLVVFAAQSSLISQDYIMIIIAALLIVLVVVIIFYFGKKRKKGKKNG